MIDLFTLLVTIIWFWRIIGISLSYIHLWFIKEYRFDRMWIHLQTTPLTKLLFPPFKLPPTTLKTSMLVIMILMPLGWLIFWLPGHLLLKFLLFDILTFPIISLWVLIFNLPTRIYHEILIFFAFRKLHEHSTMRTIGITGSFGKTSTKENIATILSTKYKVLKTESSKNSPIGIAEVLLQKLEPRHEVFVVEMGAYKRGEVARMARMVKPQVGIITAINPQHQDLFKTLDTTKKAKYELIQNLPREGIAIFNSDNEGTFELAHLAQKEGRAVWVYSKNKRRDRSGFGKVIQAKNIKVGMTDTAFTVVVGKETINVEAPVLGAHQVSNILAAIAGALAIGMNLKDISNSVPKIRPFTKTMEPVPGVNSSLFINDTLNNNPDAAKAALDYLKLTKGKKILVFQPMIELGEYAQVSHEEVGAMAAKVCDVILLTNRNWLTYFKKGVDTIDSNKKLLIVSPNSGADFIRKTVGKGDTVVFKGKEAEQVLQELKK